MGIDAVVMPLFEVRAVPWHAPDPTAFDMLLLTSANALRHGGGELGRLRLLPVAAVGEAASPGAAQPMSTPASAATRPARRKSSRRSVL